MKVKIDRLSLHQPIKYPTEKSYILKHDLTVADDCEVIYLGGGDYVITITVNADKKLKKQMFVHSSNVRSAEFTKQ